MTTIAWTPTTVHVTISTSVIATTHGYATMMEHSAVIPATATIVMPCMTSMICCIEVWMTVIEVIAMWIVCIDAEVPESIAPIEWTVEILKSAECAILPVEQYVREIKVTSGPIVCIQIRSRVYTHEIVEINLVCSLILLF